MITTTTLDATFEPALVKEMHQFGEVKFFKEQLI